MPRQQLPRIVGIIRERKSTGLHPEVRRELDLIAKGENKTFSRIIAEIVYDYFGLEVEENDAIKIRWSGREKATRKRRRAARR